jgi:glycerophosphoryl diester phosphodiesterase
MLIFFVLFYLLYLIFLWTWRKACQPFYTNKAPLLIGHRGSPVLVTENTIPSFERAIQQGVDGLEFDIRLSKDNQIVVFHDTDLKRLSNRSEKIKNLSLAEIQTVELYKNKNQEEEPYIPSLNELVPLLARVKMFNIEIKSDSLFHGHGIINPLIKFLDKYHLDDKCIISSFNPLILMKLRLKRPETIIGFLYNKNIFFHGWSNLIWMLRVRPDNLHIHYSLLNSWITRWARKKGMRINSYTINDKQILKGAKIDGIFTDNLEYLK